MKFQYLNQDQIKELKGFQYVLVQHKGHISYPQPMCLFLASISVSDIVPNSVYVETFLMSCLLFDRPEDRKEKDISS